jgi:hypothetical protein
VAGVRSRIWERRAAAAAAAAVEGVLHFSMIFAVTTARSLRAFRRPGGVPSVPAPSASVSASTSRAAIAAVCQRRWGPYHLTAKRHGDD